MSGKKGYKSLKKKLSLNKLKLVGLDSNIFIYQLHSNPFFGPTVKKEIFIPLMSGNLKAATSVITFTEILALQASVSRISSLKELLLKMSNVTFLDVNQEIAMEAAEIRREYGFKLPDAVQLATALSAKAKAFITNDQRLKAFKKLKVLSLKEIN